MNGMNECFREKEFYKFGSFARNIRNAKMALK